MKTEEIKLLVAAMTASYHLVELRNKEKFFRFFNFNFYRLIFKLKKATRKANKIHRDNKRAMEADKNGIKKNLR